MLASVLTASILLSDTAYACLSTSSPEDGVDAFDEDCDGLLSVRRDYVNGFSGSERDDFTVVKGGPISDTMTLAPTTTTPASMSLNVPLAWTTGEMHVVMNILSLTAAGGCKLDVSWSTGSASEPLALGLNDIDVPVPPGEDASLVVTCTGPSGAASIDWIVVQNGVYDFAPIDDLISDFDTTAAPGGGRMSVVRLSEDETYAFAGSDVGGFAWSDDGTDWVTANGKASSLFQRGLLSVWEILSRDGTDVYALTGGNGTAAGAGLWVSHNLGGDWFLVSDQIGNGKHADDCKAGVKAKPISSGRTMVMDTQDSSDFTYIASQNPGMRGLWVMDPDGDVCQPFDDGTLPVALPETTPSKGYDGIPAALAVYRPLNNPRRLLVGYRVLAGDLADPSDAQRKSLYVCPTVPSTFRCASAGVPLECEAMDDLDSVNDEELDVRDMEADTERSNRFYVADGGRRWSGTGSTCGSDDSTVMILDLDPAGQAEALWDSDAVPPLDLHPDWNTDSSGIQQPYYHANACPASGPGTDRGNLVPPGPNPGNETHEISGVVMGDYGEWLLAYYSAGAGSKKYGCARLFRADATGVEEDGELLAWEPVQDYGFGLMEGHNANQRRLHVDARGSWVEDSPLREEWASSLGHDAVLVRTPLGDGQDAPGNNDILFAGQLLWWLRADHGSTSTGYDSDRSLEDLDGVQWDLAWGGEGAFQDTTNNGLATCALCSLSSSGGTIDRVFTAVGDLGGVRSYPDETTGRKAAYRDCHFNTLGVGGLAVDIWQDPAGSLPAQAWQVNHNQNSDRDLDGRRTLLFSEDGGASWLWDTYAVSWRGNFMKDWTGSGEWSLSCEDRSATNLWDGAGPSTARSFDTYDVGHAVDVVAVGDRLALMLTSPTCTDETTYETCAASRTGDAGLWVVEYDPLTGMEYRRVENFDSYLPVGGTCTEEYFFSYTVDTDVVVHPDSDPSGTGEMRVFVSSRGPRNGKKDRPAADDGSALTDCGVREVRFTLGDEALAEWWNVDYDDSTSTGACDLEEQVTRGITLSRDGAQLLVFGGARSGSVTHGGGVCEVDLTSASAPPYDTAQAIHPADLALEIRRVFPHPHLTDTYFAGGVTDSDCASCTTPGLYALERRYRPVTDEWVWLLDRLSGDDLENPLVSDITWGTAGAGDRTMTDLYVATAGSGVWDGIITW